VRRAPEGNSISTGRAKPSVRDRDEPPWTVRQAAKFLGVSPQTVYLWVERRQILTYEFLPQVIRLAASERHRPSRRGRTRNWGDAGANAEEDMVRIELHSNALAK